MMRLARKGLPHLIADTRGAEIAEAAAVLPLMFMMLLGIFWFGQAFSIYGAISRAAEDGARAGSIAYCVTCVGLNTVPVYSANAVAAVQTDLLASKLNPTLAQYPSPLPTYIACPGTGSGASCISTASTNVCVQLPVLLESNNVGTGVCGISVTFRYPFQFWLPFSTLNKQKIWIQASAQVPMENP
jgi:Flp pilus assembly protein TadG